MSIIPNEKLEISVKNSNYNSELFLFLTALHIGDSDSTGAIGGFWYGALVGFDKFNTNKIEYYQELKKLSNNFIKAIKNK
jgi:ADP-ribosylglycohydrolase